MIFISYRRKDINAAHRLHLELERQIPAEFLFLDLARLDAGSNWRLAIDDAIARSTVVLAIVGPDWGQEFQARPVGEDPVLWELISAKRMNITIVPTVVSGGCWPETSIPEELRHLADVHAAFLDEPIPGAYRSKVKQLLTRLSRLENRRGVFGEIEAGLVERKFDDIRAWLSAQGDRTDPKSNLFLAVALIGGRDLDALSRSELEQVTDLVRQALQLRPEWPLAICMARVVEDECFSINGMLGPLNEWALTWRPATVNGLSDVERQILRTMTLASKTRVALLLGARPSNDF